MKLKIFSILKFFGLFQLSKFLFRKKILIIAYHGFEVSHESLFNGKLFIKTSTLEQRMNYIRKNNFNVLSLSTAIKSLDEGKSLPDNSIVITIDDGWYSTLTHAHEIFLKHAFPYTIYSTSYYTQKQIPVLNVLLRYLIWSCKKDKIDINSLHIPQLNGVYPFSDLEQKSGLQNKIIRYFNSLASTRERLEFIKNLSGLLGFYYDKIETDRVFSLLNLSEIKKLSDAGVDIQLHTHRHHLPFKQKDKFENEILENRNCLSPYIDNDMHHFCYPSGIYDPDCGRILKEMVIKSAVTCEPGFVSSKSNRYYLPRFLDGENIPQITFEAELTGISEIFRMMRSGYYNIKNILLKKRKG